MQGRQRGRTMRSAAPGQRVEATDPPLQDCLRMFIPPRATRRCTVACRRA